MRKSGQRTRILLLGAVMILLAVFFFFPRHPAPDAERVPGDSARISFWTAPDTSLILDASEGSLIAYGRDLICRTSYYLGPDGKVRAISNGMNCQNCHLEAGTKPFGNNFGSVSSLYPRYRDRSGSVESIEKRINDCLERSLNGSRLDSLSREMRAMVAYMHWLGQSVPKGRPATGAGLIPMKWLDRAADTLAGKAVYIKSCLVCHGINGEGLRFPDGSGYVYPPLWGRNSFNTAAGIFRLSNMARYIYANMPSPTTFDKPALSDEEAWDVSAYVLSQPRPEKTFMGDWPDLKKKPVDHPFGPYADSFDEKRHKYGPFPGIK